MIVLPNSFERYLMAHRIFVSLSILKYGFQPRHLENLKKIYITEAFYYKESRQSVDIYKLCNNLFRAVKSVNPNCKFCVTASNNHDVNQKLLTLLLLILTQHVEICYVYTTENHIIIETKNNTERAHRFVKAMDGYCLREVFTNRMAIIIPACKTYKASNYVESEWEFIFDKFSPFNIIYGDIISGRCKDDNNL